MEWANLTGVQDFYSNATLQSQYKDFVTSIVLRKNDFTGVLYRDDPNIIAWDLINEAGNPGDDSGQVLYVSALPANART